MLSSEGTDLLAAFENNSNCIWIFLDFVLDRRVCHTFFRYHEDLAEALLDSFVMIYRTKGKHRMF